MSEQREARRGGAGKRASNAKRAAPEQEASEQREASRDGARSERATRSEPRERSGAQGAPASERVRGLGTKSPDQNWSRRSDLNRGPADYESAALPTELR